MAEPINNEYEAYQEECTTQLHAMGKQAGVDLFGELLDYFSKALLDSSPMVFKYRDQGLSAYEALQITSWVVKAFDLGYQNSYNQHRAAKPFAATPNPNNHN